MSAEGDLDVVYVERRCPNDIHPAPEMNLTKLLAGRGGPGAENAHFLYPEDGRTITGSGVFADVIFLDRGLFFEE